MTKKAVIRRLTPLECERLQGFPDHWTDIGEWTDSKGKKHKASDSPRYKALGNSIALPFWEWLAGRMVGVLQAEGNEHPTMASLFDGIGADAEGGTCYETTTKPSYIIWHFRSMQPAKALAIYQDGGQATDAVVSVTTDGENWEELGNLTGYVSRFDLTPYPMAVAVKISWTSQAPLIYEITEETEAETINITGIKNVQGARCKVQGIDAWYDLSGRKLNGEPASKGIYIQGGRKISLF